ncbi:MAG TPA: hypothetical protein VI488_17090 [Candidatus Angelobacter sp.]
MAEDEKDRQFNAVLDSFLSDYSAVEPRPGLDLRIRAGLKSHAAQRRRKWMLAFAASASVVLLAVWIVRAHAPQEIVPNRMAVQNPSPDPAPEPLRAVTSSPHIAKRPAADDRRAILRNRSNSRILLQVANAMSQADNTVFEHERIYLSPASQPELKPAGEEHASAPNISIQHLGLPPIEIKDIPSARDMN